MSGRQLETLPMRLKARAITCRELPELLNGGSKAELERTLDKWFNERSPTDRLLLYWTGHGAPNGGHYLITRDSPKQGDLTKLNAIATGDLGDVIAKSRAEKVAGSARHLLLLRGGARHRRRPVQRYALLEPAFPASSPMSQFCPLPTRLKKPRRRFYVGP